MRLILLHVRLWKRWTYRGNLHSWMETLEGPSLLDASGPSRILSWARSVHVALWARSPLNQVSRAGYSFEVCEEFAPQHSLLRVGHDHTYTVRWSLSWRNQPLHESARGLTLRDSWAAYLIRCVKAGFNGLIFCIIDSQNTTIIYKPFPDLRHSHLYHSRRIRRYTSASDSHRHSLSNHHHERFHKAQNIEAISMWVMA